MPQTLVSPSASHMSVAAMVSPTTPGYPEQRRLEHQPSIESNHTATQGNEMGAGGASRRESVDSRINQGLSDMRLGASPYASNNQSTSSIQNTLNSQRHPRAGLEAPPINRISNGYQPSAERNPETKAIRTAPAITGPATGHIARAAEPTKGQAWAFPEEEVRSAREGYLYNASRRSSISESIASSQFTGDSRLPPGQRRLEDGPSPPSDYAMHHHSMQHRQLSDLQDPDGPTGNQPYSRTPELRVSHKLAERKRRTEMKELFDALRDEMPQERGSKASKWEILTKGECSELWIPVTYHADKVVPAINEHRAQKEAIKGWQSRCHALMNENELLRRELQAYRGEAPQYRGEGPPPPAQKHQQHQQGPPPPPPTQGPSSQHTPYPPEHYASSSRPELPPLRSISGSIPSSGPESMTGVQYDPPGNVNGYRQDRY